MSATSTESEAVEAIIDLLRGASDEQMGTTQLGTTQLGEDAWTLTDPSVYSLWGRAQKQRMNDPNPSLYVWSPADSSFGAFDAEYDHLDQTDTVEIQVWTLDPTETSQYASDVIDFLSSYGNDNESHTEFHRIRPTASNDLRGDNVARQTDHYITSVEVELRNFRPTGA